MNREQIIQMALEAGIDQEHPYIPVEYREAWFSCTVEGLERFAAAIQSAVKDEDAKICEEQADMVVDQRGAAPVKAMMCASAILASK